MDLDWCIVCDRHTNGGIYCSQECRLKDTPSELIGKPPIVPGPLDVKKLAVPFNSYSSNLLFGRRGNTNEEEDDDGETRAGYRTLAEDVFVSFGPLTQNRDNTQKRTILTNNNNNNAQNLPVTNNSTKKRISSKFLNPLNVRAF